MAIHSTDGLNYLVRISNQYKVHLYALRYWKDLQVAFDHTHTWLKGLTEEQLDHMHLQTIPFRQVYYEKEGMLFKKGALLPSEILPVLNWEPIEKGLPVTLPSLNHNYFGVDGQIQVALEKWECEMPASAQRVSMQHLEQYLRTASSVRTGSIYWVAGMEEALIMGSPLLPLPGTVYWQQDNFLLPAGYNLQLHSLSQILSERIDPLKQYIIIWNVNGSYSRVMRQWFKPLSLGSLNLTINSVSYE